MGTFISKNQNHLKLGRFHTAFAVLWGVVYGSLAVFAWGSLTESGRIWIPLLAVVMPTFHLALSRGCKNGSELARKISVFLGAIMLLLIPVGTIVGLIFLSFTKWKIEAPVSEEAPNHSLKADVPDGPRP